MKTARERFAYNLKNIRKNKEMNQEALALKCDVSETTVTNWETGKMFPSANNIDLICKALGCKPMDLFSEEVCFENKKDNKRMEIEKLYRLENTILCLKAMGIHEHIHEMLKDVPDYFLYEMINRLENNINYIEKDLIVTKEIVEVIKKKCKGVKE